MSLEKPEIKYIFYAGLFQLIYFIFLLPYLMKTLPLNPYIRFLVFQIGIFFVYIIFLKSISLGTKTDIMTAFVLVLLSLNMDIIQPEFHVTYTGDLIDGAVLGNVTFDYIAGLFGQSIGIFGFLLYFFVYVVIPFIIFYVVALLRKNF